VEAIRPLRSLQPEIDRTVEQNGDQRLDPLAVPKRSAVVTQVHIQTAPCPDSERRAEKRSVSTMAARRDAAAMT
jgi:hypothetical protein